MSKADKRKAAAEAKADETKAEETNGETMAEIAPAADALTPGERADLERYNADMAAEIAAMDDVELGLLAKRAEVDAAAYADREALAVAVKAKVAADFVAGKLALHKMVEDENTKADAVLVGQERGDSAIIRRLNAEFCRELPEGVISGSAFEPAEDHPRFGGEYAVADGRYRVVGSDFVFEIAGRRMAQAFAATRANAWGGGKVIAIE